MIKENFKYYPCDTCKHKDPYTGKCPMAKKYMCPLYNVCNGMSMMIENDGSSHSDVPVEMIVELLRKLGYAGELRKVTVTNI